MLPGGDIVCTSIKVAFPCSVVVLTGGDVAFPTGKVASLVLRLC